MGHSSWHLPGDGDMGSVTATPSAGHCFYLFVYEFNTKQSNHCSFISVTHWTDGIIRSDGISRACKVLLRETAFIHAQLYPAKFAWIPITFIHKMHSSFLDLDNCVHLHKKLIGNKILYYKTSHLFHFITGGLCTSLESTWPSQWWGGLKGKGYLAILSKIFSSKVLVLLALFAVIAPVLYQQGKKKPFCVLCLFWVTKSLNVSFFSYSRVAQ